MSLWRRSIALAALVYWSLRATWRIIVFMLQAPRDALWALQAARAAEARESAREQSMDRARPHQPRLELVGPSLLRLKAHASQGIEASEGAREASVEAAQRRSPVMLYFTGTGETPEAVLLGFQHLRQRVPALADATEYVVAQPVNKGAYYNGNQFAARMWDVVSPLVTHYPGPFVLVGFSRGALVALEVATRIAEEHAKVATALALSPPVLVPERLPLPVTTVARFEIFLEGIREATQELPSWIGRQAERHLWFGQVLLTAMVLKNLGVLGREELEFAVNDMRERGAFESGLSAAREFRLLQEAQPRESDLFTEGLTRTFAESRRLYAELVWGSADTWVAAAACRARMEALFVRYPAARVHMKVREIEGQGHALFRATGADGEPTLRCLSRVADAAVQRAAALEHDARQTSQQSAIQALRATEEMP